MSNQDSNNQYSSLSIQDKVVVSNLENTTEHGANIGKAKKEDFGYE